MKYGEQAKLPSWVTRGSIIGLQGGSNRVLEIYRSSIMRDIDVRITFPNSRSKRNFLKITLDRNLNSQIKSIILEWPG